MTTNNCTDCVTPAFVSHLPHYSSGEKILITFVLSCMALLTFTGNTILIFAVVTCARLRKRINVFVVGRAVSDISVSVMVMPFAISRLMENHRWRLGNTMCIIALSFDLMLCTVSIYHLSCLAVDRYLHICRPSIEYQLTINNVVVMLICCWVMPIFISFLPITKKWNLIGLARDITISSLRYDCIFVANLGYAFSVTLIAFIFPAAFIGTCYWKIFQTTHLQVSAVSVTGTRSKETRAARTLGIIIICFALCWLPFFIVNLVDPLVDNDLPSVAWLVAKWMGYSNSMINPFLYYCLSKSFRYSFVHILKCKESFLC